MSASRAWWHRPWIVGGLIAAGLALRAFAYFSNVTLWLDEILLSRNIIEAPVSTLAAAPLSLDQVAPRGFLLAERLSVAMFGPNELALRLLPFLCGLATLWLFWRLARRVLTEGAAIIALLLVAIGVPFLLYGVVVKQYAVDAAATTAFVLIAFELRDRDQSNTRLIAAGAAGVAVVWFSQGAAMVMAGLGMAIALEWLLTRNPRSARVLLYTMPLWAAGALAAVVAGKRAMTPAMQQFMDDFWATGFLPLPFGIASSAGWLWDRLVQFFAEPALLRYPGAPVYALLTIAGIIVIWRQRPVVAALLAGPVIAYLGAAIAQQYPFRARLVFGLTPIVILALAAGLDWIARGVARVHPALAAAVVAAGLAAPVRALAAAPPPYELEQHRAMLTYLKAHRQAGDVIYVFPLQRIGMDFYGERYGLLPRDWTIATCDRDDTRAYVRDVDRFRGQSRVWVLSAGTRPYRAARVAVRDYLGTIGHKRDALELPSLTLTSVSLERFDLTDPVKLAAATAETFPVPPMPTDPRPGCRPWVRPGYQLSFETAR